ncbi:hypothetical protein RclHR1_00200034 [Rhizophagus clarus]|uniref:F-box domain-containing protein n=1 Tax=Rhizophagus clarus TaxID=94130 RepID=A0A2Z6R608_9GLOM|nr:hypothetical protein RclHR1_00200034 [Rhizophagus clarus]GES99476.1 hypothetical protein GLOIN_2v1876445 [Rhizophagus clarus]
MPRLLPADCLNEIFECLEDDKITLHSCLLVNRLYCEIAVRILWRNVWNFKYNLQYISRVSSSIIGTLISCLPKESKELLHKNGIFIVARTQKSPFFNYPSFCKVLSIHKIDQIIQYTLETQQSINNLRSMNYIKYLFSQEIFKMFMNQISSLKSLDYYSEESKNIQNIMIIYFPGAENCLTYLTELNCSSDVYPEFFYQISQLCHNIKSITIDFEDVISDGLIELISLQKNLKNLKLISNNYGGTENFTSSLTKSSLTLTRLIIMQYHIPLTFISVFKNLQELVLSFDYRDSFYDFNVLQYISFPHLKVLKFLFAIPRIDILIKFLEINGKNLTEFHVGDHDNSLNLAVAKFCPSIKILFTLFKENELETLKTILNNCQYLENIKIWCGDDYLNDKELLNVLVNHSPKYFHELGIFYCSINKSSIILPKELDEFFMNWKNRLTQESISLTIYKNFDGIGLDANLENMEIINKYMKMGLIAKFTTKEYDYFEY